MTDGAFWFVLTLLALAFVVTFIEWFLRRPLSQDEILKARHHQLMQEIRRHKDD